uniref:Uncharacterized protein n=1 Tax=Aegilops tauschii subsp. strangulata TaxID=200361 RepID=A0A453F7K7_AEGTS
GASSWKASTVPDGRSLARCPVLWLCSSHCCRCPLCLLPSNRSLRMCSRDLKGMKLVIGFYLPPILDCLARKRSKTEDKLGSWVAVSGEKNMGGWWCCSFSVAF